MGQQQQHRAHQDSGDIREPFVASIDDAKGRRNAVVGVIALAVVVLAALAISRFQVRDDWTAEFTRFIALERTSQERFHEAITEVQAGTTPAQQFSNLVDAQLSTWYGERERLLGLPTPPSQQALAHGVAQFMTLRGESWRLAAAGISTDDPALLRSSHLKEETALESMQSLLQDEAAVSRVAQRKANGKAMDESLVARMTRSDQVNTAPIAMALTQFRSGTLSEATFADTVETTLRQWKTEQNRYSREPVSALERERVEELRRYTQLRIEMWRLLARDMPRTAALRRQPHPQERAGAALPRPPLT